MCLSTNGSESKDYTIFIWMILTSNTEATEATENKVEFLNYAYTVKGFQYNSSNSLQLFELKENNNKTTKQYTVFKRLWYSLAK